ncbi:arsenate reductase family protein [Moraxella nonliquefaciens]|uniref:Arsenate reductase n=1 Tax=Moraxella nonliquefaciens TaxID=478 RepID=A0A1B8QRZ1_MORNO|nr:Spx/MgsR family RNA polymerase-binding regulatory protein [Moraxella nonliquefaciens]MDI4498093.1 Spx/MgsR family RNA polymerase-binding regulatory protein [Moraxella nonliquefaciens]MDI4499857.1 Spx/MgsR family RNA polymerase-binding regulatory protein [Moraxella nonliquefaciens]OBX87122.1 arsenate reductase [Moraxella nonliquefaciens]QPT44262.1 Spx/MgsR family RNA polymerase-binding regulatory protein [Moraxella nonliquefaciens]QQC29282.1 Spx/MgsR family RNA polymerase-binding regulatory 
MTTIYGINNCNTMKKAFDFFNQNGITYEFFDYKKSVLSQDDFANFVATFGEKVINKQGTTYRKFDDETKAILASDDLPAMYEMVKNNLSVLKRPIVMGDDVALIGFDEHEWGGVFGV